MFKLKITNLYLVAEVSMSKILKIYKSQSQKLFPIQQYYKVGVCACV